MYRLFVIVLVALVACWAIPAVAAPGDIHVGVKGGLNLANMGGDSLDGVDTSMKTGFGAGGVFSYTVSDIFSIQPEVLYTQKGFKETDNSSGTEETYKFKVNYIEIPVLAKVSMPPKPGNKFLPHFLIGPAVAIEAGCKQAGESGGASFEADCDSQELDPEFQIKTKSVDVGGVVGAGMDFLAGPKGMVTLDARFTMGLTNIIDQEGEDAKNRNISIMVGYTMALGASSTE